MATPNQRRATRTGQPGLQAQTLSETVHRLLELLTPGERRGLALVLLAALITTAFEALGAASILPFMAIVVDPGVIDRYPTLGFLAERVGAHTWRDAVVWAAAATCLMVALANTAKFTGAWLQWRFEARVHQRLASDLLRAVLLAPYAFHIKRDAPSLMRAVNGDVSAVTGSILMPLLSAVSSICVVLALLGLLAVQSPLVAAAAIGTLGGAYFAAFSFARTRQSRLTDQWREADYERQVISHEAFGGIKELMVLGRREITSARFAVVARRLAGLSVGKKVWQVLPRHALETITVICILVVTVSLLGSQESGAASAIPTLALYTFVGYRLLPSLQQLYSSAVSLRYARPSLNALYADWLATGAGGHLPDSGDEVAGPTLRTQVSLRNVSFTYSGTPRPAVSDVSLEIRKGESIGLIGRTGAGKSTLADILLGLFPPDSGAVLVDGVPLTPTSVGGWRRQVGYVAQHIFLANLSISQNIAFGLPPGLVDHHAVVEAAKLAQVDTFIANLPKGYDTIVGERGVRLSGGERQRLGIARALYRRPSVLIFDEATSALDGMTEEAVMDAIRTLSGERTVVLIAHRLTTLEACDRVVLLERGQVMAVGALADLRANSAAFAQFVTRT